MKTIEEGKKQKKRKKDLSHFQTHYFFPSPPTNHQRRPFPLLLDPPPLAERDLTHQRRNLLCVCVRVDIDILLLLHLVSTIVVAVVVIIVGTSTVAFNSLLIRLRLHLHLRCRGRCRRHSHRRQVLLLRKRTPRTSSPSSSEFGVESLDDARTRNDAATHLRLRLGRLAVSLRVRVRMCDGASDDLAYVDAVVEGVGRGDGRRGRRGSYGEVLGVGVW